MNVSGNRGSDTTWGSKLARARPWLCRIVPTVAVLFFLSWCFISLRSDFSWDDAEPEILNQAWRLAQGETIYRGIDTPPFAFAAYPPLYYALTALLLKFTGLNFLPAKLISFLSTLSIGWAIMRLNRQWNKTPQGGIWAIFFLFLIPAFLYNAARSHAQMMAVALSIWSLVFFLRNRWAETVIVSPLLAVLAVYTKQTQIALPLAMVAYLALRNKRWLLMYVTTGVAAGLIPLLWLQRITGGNFLLDTIQLARLPYDVLQILPVFLHQAGPIILFIGLALYISWQRFRQGCWDAMDLYLSCLIVTAMVSLGRAGAHGQYVLELLVVTMLYLLRTGGLPFLRGRDTLVSIQIIFLLIYTPLFIFLEEGLWDMASNRAAKKIYPLIKTDRGPILSQQGSFALFSRGEIYIQLFHFSSLSRVGLWDQDLLLREIDKHTFSWVITEFPIEEPITNANDSERFTPEMQAALRKNYRLRESFYPYYLYGPRQPGGL
jgi:hypothetical protein